MNKSEKRILAGKLVRMAKDLMAGCDKLPEGGMRDNCEKKKKEKKARNVKAKMNYSQFKSKLDRVYSESQKMLSMGEGWALSDDALNRIGKKQFGTAWSVISEALFEAEVYDDFTEN